MTASPGGSQPAEMQPLQAQEQEQLLPAGVAASAGGAAATSALPFTSLELAEADWDRGSSSDSRQWRAAAVCLCAAHALARWGWRTWEFAVALILIRLFPSSLLLVSLYGLLDNLCRLLLGAWMGQYIDRADRLRGAQLCYAIQSMCIAVSAAAAALLVWLDERLSGGMRPRHPALYWLLVSCCMVLGASSSVGSLGAAVAVEREYTKTLCGDDSAALRKLNSAMRAIDLLSQMLAPVVAGFLMSYGSLLAAIAVLAVYSVCAVVPQCLLLQAAHGRSPELRRPKAPGLPASALHKRLLGAPGWAAYFGQSTLLPSLALALLYLTVLSLGFLMTSFLAWQGMSEATISLFRAAGALSGLAATAIFHPLQRCGAGLVAAGGLGIAWQLVCLLGGVMPVVLARFIGAQGGLQQPQAAFATHANTTAPVQPPLSAAGQPAAGSHRLLFVLLSGLVASRFGLWLFDLAVSQLQQELVLATELGAISGVQASMQSAFEILSFVAGSIIHQPQHFHWLMAASCGSVATAAGLFCAYACRGQRRH